MDQIQILNSGMGMPGKSVWLRTGEALELARGLMLGISRDQETDDANLWLCSPSRQRAVRSVIPAGIFLDLEIFGGGGVLPIAEEVNDRGERRFLLKISPALAPTHAAAAEG